MTVAEFKKKWGRYTGKESAGYQEHFNDLCRILGHPTPAEADPSGADFFCFQKRVVKDAELFLLQDSPESGGAEERGFADVWKKDCFGWEYKGKRKNLNERPAWLDLAHRNLDAAVAAAYGWPPDLSDDQILEKLLALNLERAAEEASAGKAQKPRTSRDKHTDEMI